MEAKRILITGITGFAGSHLAEALLPLGVELYGVSRSAEWPRELAELAGQTHLCTVDLCDTHKLTTLLTEIAPAEIYHLAGFADVGKSLQQPEQAWRDNFHATQTLYRSVLQWGGQPRILYAGSGLVYGEPRDDRHIFDEKSALYPTTPYAASKAAADLLGYQLSRHPGLCIIRARPFNHIGPRQSPRFAIAHFAQQIAAIELGWQPPVVRTGNLDARRDITDVRDMVRAYQLLMEHGRAGEAYNIAAEQVWSMRDLLGQLVQHSRVHVQVQAQEQLLRATETRVVRASAARLQRLTAWRPRIALPQTLSDTLAYWRQHLQQTPAPRRLAS